MLVTHPAGDCTCRPSDRSLLAQVTSAYISPCVQNLVPEDTDLVLIEFTFNDSERTKSREFEDPTRCAAWHRLNGREFFARLPSNDHHCHVCRD